ncbi:MAG: hypothetical protein LBU38_04940, partial [Propionibacteriaceae bacterium]|nr:hypothetical protein [Propionibacteriaceae bacterium]
MVSPSISIDSPALVNWVREVAGVQDPRIGPTTPVTRMVIPAVATRPKREEHAKVFVCGGVVVKIHEAGTSFTELRARLECIDCVELERIW